MTTTAARAVSNSSSSTASGGPLGPVRRRRIRLAVHAVAYLALLLTLLAVTDLRQSWNLDDGAYATQVAVLDETGSWAYPYAHRNVDPDSRYAPISHATTTERGAYPYAKLPAWIEVLRAGTWVFGRPVGLYVPSVLGAVVAALLASALVERLSSGAGLIGFWAVALGPLVVHTQAMWAHTVAAALGAAAALVVVAVAERRERYWHLTAGCALLVAMVSVRNEGILFAAALAAVVGALLAARSGSFVGRLAKSAFWSAPLLVLGLVTRALVLRWASQVAPGRDIAVAEDRPGGQGLVAGRSTGAARTLLDGLGASPVGTLLALVAVALSIWAGVVVGRRAGRSPEGWLALMIALALIVVRGVVVAPDDLAGFLLAVPLVAMAAGALRWGRSSTPERALVGLIGLHGLAVLATQYPEGGSRDWGGRFMFPVLVPAVVVSLVILHRLLAPGTSGRRNIATAALLLACGLPTLVGLHGVARARASNRAATELTRQVGAEVPTIIKVPRYLTRTSWRLLPGPDWLSAQPDTAGRALALLRPGRMEPIAVIGNGADEVRARRYRREVRSPVVVVFTPD